MDTVLQIIASDTLRNFLLFLIVCMVATSGNAIVEIIRDSSNKELTNIKEQLSLIHLHQGKEIDILSDINSTLGDIDDRDRAKKL
tara:strand:- start:218 stop:472 length:255 start_codon:yes stop_codon:yes gene_type:complete